MRNNDFIIVTNWEKVNAGDFYLSDDYLKEIGDRKEQKKLKKMARNGELYEAYIVPAVSYVIYFQMDAEQVYIDKDGNVLLQCESAVIGNKHANKWAMKE